MCTRMAGHGRAAHIQQEPFVDVIYDAVDGALLGAGEVCKGQHGARVVAHRDRLGVDALVAQRRADVELAKHLRDGTAPAGSDAASSNWLQLCVNCRETHLRRKT